MFSNKKEATNLLISVVIALILLKLIVSWITRSMSILAQAADSLLDLFAGIITFSAVRIATKPADEDHPYGHGKVEDIAGLAQGLLIFIAGGLIIYSSIIRIIKGSQVKATEAGIAVMLISIGVSIFLSRYLYAVSKTTDSPVLEANARNIAADVYSALAVLIGLAIVRITNLNMIDSIIAIGMAIYILRIAFITACKPIVGLIDSKLPASEERVIKRCLADHRNSIVGFHSLRTRHAGSQHYIDLHLVLAGNINIDQAHEICDRIEKEIEKELVEANVTIHIEPCTDECPQCPVVCSNRRPV